MEIRTEEQVTQAVYELLKESFSDLKRGWIYEDYFKNIEGYEHFVTQFKQEYSNIQTNFEDEQELGDYVYDCFSTIESELNKNHFLNMCSQSM